MKCTVDGCKRSWPVRVRRWSPADSEAMRAAGWFVWDRRAPVYWRKQCVQGMVICPDCRRTLEGQRQEQEHDAALASET